MPRTIPRILLLVAFLAAQAAGVAHQAWHDAGPVAAHAGVDGSDGKTPKKSPLCDFHTALGSVLGALAGAHAQPDFGLQEAASFAAAESRAARFPLHASLSRGPPALV